MKQKKSERFLGVQKSRRFLTCPICEKGNLKKTTIKEEMFGVFLGNFPAEVCNNCKESFTDEETTRRIESIAKQKGIWGLGFKTKITQAGNSLVIRIPKKIVNYFKLKKEKEVYLYPESGKIMIETQK